MNTKRTILGLVAVAGLATCAMAQDSVSRTRGVAGSDAVSPYLTAEQCNSYIVDLSELRTSWGNVFGVAPIAKLSKFDANFFTGLPSAQSLSNTTLRDVSSPVGQYSYWNAQGFGVNNDPAINLPGQPFPGPDRSFQLGWTLAGFGASTANDIIGGFINYNPSEECRLFVTRTNIAVNGANAGQNLSQFGIGSVDANGNVILRADNGASNNDRHQVWRVDAGLRNCDQLNIINVAGAGSATDVPASLKYTGPTATVLNPPNVVPENINGGFPRLITANFATQYLYNSNPATEAPIITTTTAHRPGTTDHRGAVAYTHRNFARLNSVDGLAGVLSKPNQDGGATTGLSIWGLDTNGGVTGTLLLVLPQNGIVDNNGGQDTFDTSQYLPGTDEFEGYRSQTAFRGGTSQLALGLDQANNLVAAATVYSPGGVADNPVNYITVARTDAQGNTRWTLAAWNFFQGGSNVVTGKRIFDGPGAGAGVIGELAELNEVTGGSPLGPSFSSPAIDSVGNVWFIGAVELFNRIDRDGDGFAESSDFDSALLRAVYNPANFSYQLELVAELGTVIRGRNSDTDYRINFLSIADSNSIDSATLYSSNVNQQTYAGADRATLTTDDPRTLGGLIFAAEVVYDVNRDGRFIKVTGQNGDPNSLDQEYRVAMFLAGSTCRASCPADFNSDGIVDSDDFFDFLNAFNLGDPSADFNGDGLVDSDDFFDFLNAFNAGC